MAVPQVSASPAESQTSSPGGADPPEYLQEEEGSSQPRRASQREEGASSPAVVVVPPHEQDHVGFGRVSVQGGNGAGGDVQFSRNSEQHQRPAGGGRKTAAGEVSSAPPGSSWADLLRQAGSEQERLLHENASLRESISEHIAAAEEAKQVSRRAVEESREAEGRRKENQACLEEITRQLLAQQKRFAEEKARLVQELEQARQETNTTKGALEQSRKDLDTLNRRAQFLERQRDAARTSEQRIAQAMLVLDEKVKKRRPRTPEVPRATQTTEVLPPLAGPTPEEEKRQRHRRESTLRRRAVENYLCMERWLPTPLLMKEMRYRAVDPQKGEEDFGP